MIPTEAVAHFAGKLPTNIDRQSPEEAVDREAVAALETLRREVDRLSTAIDHEQAVWGVLDAKVRDQEQMLNATNGELDYALGLVAVDDPPDSDECEPGERVAWLTHEILEPVLSLLSELASDRPCSPGGDGHCHTHMWLTDQESCPHKRARALMHAIDRAEEAQ